MGVFIVLVLANQTAICFPAGYGNGSIPMMASNDTIEVFQLQAPVWEFKFGDLLGDFVSPCTCSCACVSEVLHFVLYVRLLVCPSASHC